MSEVSIERVISKSNKGNESGQESNKYWTYHKHSQSVESVYHGSFCKVGEKFLATSKMLVNGGFQTSAGEMASIQSDNIAQNSPGGSNESIRSPPPYPTYDASFASHPGINEVFSSYNDTDQQVRHISLISLCILQVFILYVVKPLFSSSTKIQENGSLNRNMIIYNS